MKSAHLRYRLFPTAAFWKLLKIELPCPEGQQFASLRSGHSCKSFSGRLATISPY